MLDGLTPPKNRAVYCRVADLAAEMQETDRVIFMAAVDDPATWRANTLSTALKHRGTYVADTTISRHRNRVCACYRG